jgi:hypothetical protein
MTDAEYRAIKAVNYSSLKLIRKSPKHYKHNLDNPEPENPSKYAELRAIHALLLEPFLFEEQFAVYEGRRDKRVKEYVDFLATVGDRTVITPAERDAAQVVADAFRAHAGVEDLLAQPTTDYEVAMVWTDPGTGIACKGKADVIGIEVFEAPDQGDGMTTVRSARLLVADLKSFYTTQPAAVARHGKQNGWFEQLAHYTRGALAKIQAEHGIEPDMVEVIWQSIIAEQKAPHDVVIIEWGERVQVEAQNTLSSWLETLKECLESDQWPGRGDYAKVQSFDYNGIEIEGEDA